MRIGFIGCGVMGRPMALHLLRGGHRVAVWARRQEAAKPLLVAGAVACASPAAVAAAAEVVFTVVTADADVEQIAFAAGGLAEGFAAASILVDMSTIAPLAARSIAGRLATRGVDMLDAPVSGGGQGAIDASLSIMVGGRAAVLERVRPLFELLGSTIVHVGDHGAGQVAKACNQMLIDERPLDHVVASKPGRPATARSRSRARRARRAWKCRRASPGCRRSSPGRAPASSGGRPRSAKSAAAVDQLR
jgi:2-hydroxy-3-oxopropionate reductase